jgi:hypothetical protein
MARTAEKPKRGRPPMAPGVAKRLTVGVIVNEAELATLRRKAERAKLSLSKFIRRFGVQH